MTIHFPLGEPLPPWAVLTWWPEAFTYVVKLKQVRDIIRCFVVQGLVHQQQDLELKGIIFVYSCTSPWLHRVKYYNVGELLVSQQCLSFRSHASSLEVWFQNWKVEHAIDIHAMVPRICIPMVARTCVPMHMQCFVHTSCSLHTVRC